MDWPYISGFFDGEGCIYKYKNDPEAHSFSIRMDFTQKKNLQVLLDIQRFLHHHEIDSRLLDLGPDKAYRLRIGKSSHCLYLIESMMPYLIVYRDKAIVALHILKTKEKHRTHIPLEELRTIRKLRDESKMSIKEISHLSGRPIRTITYLVYKGQVKNLNERRIDDLIRRQETGHLFQRADGWL